MTDQSPPLTTSVGRYLPPARRAWRAVKRGLKLALLATIIALVVAPEWPAFRAEDFRLRAIIGQRSFDFLVWEIEALVAKGASFVSGGHLFLPDEEQSQLVLDYLTLIAAAGQLEREIATLYADPAVPNPEAEAAEAEAALTKARSEMARLQPLAEAVVEAQVGAVLVDEGFGILGEAWPPVQMHITPVPALVAVSPRDRIERIYGIPVQPGLTAADRDRLENQILADVNLSALIVPLAGIGTYPAMIVERSDINTVTDITAHEWAHHWLTLQPVGIRYGASPELRIINETTASIVGTEVGRLVVTRFYPNQLPPPPQPPPLPGPETEPEPFDAFATLRETRVEVDRLLAAGAVTEAEAYMEQRRQYLWDNGYRLRKLNQAFFAFYGAYADEPGATGDDPIGPTIVAIRQNSPSLRAFMDIMAPVTSLADLEALAPT